MEKLEKNLHEKFVLYGKNAREWTRKCSLLLPEIARLEIWRKRGFGSIYEYAAKLAGMNKNTVDHALWIGRKIEDKPALKQAAMEKGINIIKPIAAIVTTETDSFWAEKVMEMSKSALEAYAKEFKKIVPGDKNCYQIQNLFLDIKTETIPMEISPETANELRKLKGQSDWEELMRKFIALYKKDFEQNKPQSIKNAKRHIPAAIKNYAITKTAGACAFPDCTKPYEILHHAERYALTHKHNPDTLVPLCKAHEQLAHYGLIENESVQPSEWRVRLAPDRTDKKYLIDQKVIRYRVAAGGITDG